MEKILKTELVESFIKKNGIEIMDFCKLCKISPTIFKGFLNNDLTLDLNIVFKIAKVLQIKLYEMFI